MQTARWGILPGLAMLLGTTMLLGAPFVAQAKQSKTFVSDGDLSTLNILNAASHFICGNDPRAGSVSEVDGRLRRLGRVRVKVSASWDWGLFSSDHPGALVDVSPQALGDVNACTPFLTDATVTFTASRRRGPLNASPSTIVADVVGGSVDQVAVSPDPRVTAASFGGTCPAIGIPNIDGTIDELLISFDADPSQADTPHGSISGSSYQARIKRLNGLMRARFNSCTGTFDVNQIIYTVTRP